MRRLPDALHGAAIGFDVTDGEMGALGLPRWTTVWFHAEHSDYNRLRCDVVERVEQAGLSEVVLELKS